MKKASPFPVTQENFPQCWEYVDNRRRIARRRAAAAKAGGFLVNLFFLFSLIFLANGLIYEHIGGSYGRFLTSIPHFLSLWKTIAGAWLSPGASVWEDCAKFLLAAYLVSAAVFAVLTGLICLLYHPRKAPLPAGSYAENTALLAKKAQEARDASYETQIRTSIVGTVLAVTAVFVLFFAYGLSIQDAQRITSLLSLFPTQDAATNALLYVLVMYCVSDFLCSVLLFVTRPLYRYDFPYDLVVQAQRSALYAGEDSLGLSPEALEAKHKTDAAALREEALELERARAYAKATRMLLTAAIAGDVSAMEHYARHCLLSRMKDSARYWLKTCTQSPDASKAAKKMALYLKLGLTPDLCYLGMEKPKKGIVKTCFTILWRLLILAVTVAACYGCYVLFDSTQNPETYARVNAWIEEMREKLPFLETLEEPLPEAVLTEIPVMTLSDADTPWEGQCVQTDMEGNPVVFCYSKTTGGDLYAAYQPYGGVTVKKASLYTGNKWNMAKIQDAVTYAPATNTITVAESYLLSLEPGEYFIVIEAGDAVNRTTSTQYLPLIVYEEIPFVCAQRGLAAKGNDGNWIVSDLQDLKDITLPFYNTDNNPIVSLYQVTRYTMSPNPLEMPVAEEYYTISPDGQAVTIKAAFWAQQKPGSYVDFKVRLANADTLDTGDTHVGTVDGEYTGLLELQGSETYSLSKDGDYIVTFDHALALDIYNVSLYHNGTALIQDDDLMDFVSDYVDFDNDRIVFPEEILKGAVVRGDSFQIFVGYSTVFSQFANTSLDVQAVY